MDQQRIAKRRRILKAGTIEFGGGGLDCTVRNLSETGAALEVVTPLFIPDRFTLFPNGEAGELWVRGPMVVKGYWRKPEATEETFGGGWLRTGDIAKMDAEGFCYIVDRAKDMLIRGGENIYCVEVENALAAHPDVIDAAVVGRPHKVLGEEPVAVVTVRSGSTLDEATLRDFVRERLAAFKAPVSILIREEMLPRNANGKIMKRDLRKLFAA